MSPVTESISGAQSRDRASYRTDTWVSQASAHEEVMSQPAVRRKPVRYELPMPEHREDWSLDYSTFQIEKKGVFVTATAYDRGGL
jgi:hypothetical protein